MDVTEKCRQIMNSNLTDELKFELIGLLQNQKVEYTPYRITYPNQWEDSKWWRTMGTGLITDGENVPYPNKDKSVWDDSGWWEQHLRDAQGDVDSIIHPLFQWTEKDFLSH